MRRPLTRVRCDVCGLLSEYDEGHQQQHPDGWGQLTCYGGAAVQISEALGREVQRNPTGGARAESVDVCSLCIATLCQAIHHRAEAVT